MAALLVASCGGGGGGGGNENPVPPPPPPPPPAPQALFQTPALVNLTVSDVERIIAQGVAEAQAQGQPSGFIVIDRVGNVLAAFVMNGTDLTLRTPPAPNGRSTDLQDLDLPAPAALAGGISKALTSSYFSSMGAAFSSRTANDIVQETFPPSRGTRGLESGPLFSVQFSQLPCSDVASRFPNRAGSHRGPLGVGADPGAFPLYKNGAVVGSVAVIGDGVYGFDTEFLDKDGNVEEVIALAATAGFEPAPQIRANRIAVDGTLLRYSDATPADFRSSPGSAPAFASINGTVGNLVAIRGYNDAVIVPGTVYGSEESGIRPAAAGEYDVPEVWVVSDGAGSNRYPARAGTDGAGALSASEVRALLEEAFKVQRAARAQLRYPLDNRAQNTMVVVDTNGEILGLVRGPDALVDAIDAVPQKARTTVFFSSRFAAPDLLANPTSGVSDYVAAVRTFLGDPSALTGNTAFSLRGIGNIARPWFPDGQLGRPPGPLSGPIEQFNIFSTGLQSRLITDDILGHVGFVLGANATDVPRSCTRSPQVRPGRNRINNGITLFAGGVPIYRGNQLVGAIASSGDGNDQSDMIAFLGLHNAGIRLGGSIGNADPANRSDRIQIPTGSTTTRLRWVLCPFNPFVGTNEQNVCQGK
ncbi:heme-binding protein [Sphingosinicella sp. CPCC 101087]|uniref:heme-binding protein n=1 Tax=Sphingosinicella sp. CPCC 101087 TaxID=2497754 RepID=UPI00101BAA4F|nr:heme-binding protein [Sphingosinicella sp. CPCC 101087]